MKRFTRAVSICALGALATCGGGGGGGSGGGGGTANATNVLLIVADDLGVDMLGAWGVHPDVPPTPNIDALIAQGVLFERAYTAPSCSPTRAAVLTGRLGFHTGLGKPIDQWLPEHALELDERTLPEVLSAGSASPIHNGAIGKWHLGSESFGGADHPNLQGFEWFEGTLGNLFFGDTYFQYTKVTNGVASTSTTYATTEQVDDALARIDAMPQPWFLYLCFNAPHDPLHVPPAALHTYNLSGLPEDTPHEHHCAAVQALDTELGRLFAGIDPAVLANTTVVFMGDNGSPNQVVTPPSVSGQCKGTLYEGGVRVPLVIAGKNVDAVGQRCSALVESVDLFPTIVELMGANLAQGLGDGRPIEGLSLAPYLADAAHPPMREYVVAERFSPNGYPPYNSYTAMVRDVRWKLLRRDNQLDALYDMQGLDFEGANLNDGDLTQEETDALLRLQAALSAALPGQ
jgi:arylsulfatase A-like enzyme